jgi:hypothetical protein
MEENMVDANSPESVDPAEAQTPVSAEVPEKSARERAEELMKSLNHDKAINEIFSDAFERQYLIYGKCPKEWLRYFRINIPENPDTSQCKALAAKVASLTQEANFYFAAAEAQTDALSSGEDREFSTNFNRLVAEYKGKNKSLPASKTLETMAKAKMSDIGGAIRNAHIVKNFWKRILEGLVEVRKNLELATWNNSTQAKQDGYGNLPSHQPNRGEIGGASKDALKDDWA